MYHFLITREKCTITLPPPNFNGHDYVDLGLPSHTLWATQNVGARKPSDYGLYFAWGDAQGYSADQIGNGEGQKKFSEDYSDYKWYLSGTIDENNLKFTKYTTPGAILDLEDDAAHVHMGGDWHMPTPNQFQELLDNTTSTLTTRGGVNGRLFTSKNGKSIFIPAAGTAENGVVDNSGDFGDVWSSMLYAEGVDNAKYLEFGPENAGGLYSYYRHVGYSVRGVIG